MRDVTLSTVGISGEKRFRIAAAFEIVSLFFRRVKYRRPCVRMLPDRNNLQLFTCLLSVSLRKRVSLATFHILLRFQKEVIHRRTTHTTNKVF